MRKLLLLICWLLAGCSDDLPSAPENLQLNVKAASAALQETPGPQGMVLANLKKGTRLVDLNQVSAFVTPLLLGDSAVQTPWIKVIAPGNQSGWVYAGAVAPLKGKDADWQTQKTMQSYLGPVLLQRRNKWVAQLPGPDNPAAFAGYYREGLALRDSICQVLAHRTESNDAHFEPDYQWLNQVLPGYLVQWINHRQQPFLFCDYRFWQRLAAAPEAAAYFNTVVAAFPRDSIESFFPCWMIQTGEDSGCSQLGSGVHLVMLQRVDAALKNGKNPFEKEIIALKDHLLNDIIGQTAGYWQPADKIIAELGQLIQANPDCLSSRDKLALQERIEMFKNPGANHIKVNLRSGME